MTAESPKKVEPFVIIREFAAPRDLVWKAWTEPQRLTEWFGPKGSKGEILEFDLRPGGLWRGRMENSVGPVPVMYSYFKFRDVTPPFRLVWEHSFGTPDGKGIARAPFSDTWPLVMLTTVEFEEIAGTTKVTIFWDPLDATDAEIATFEEAKPGMTIGWGGSFERLDDYLAGL